MAKATARKYHVLLGCTGSVASIKIPEIVQALQHIRLNIEIEIVSTENALHFFNKKEVPVRVYTDKDEWDMWQERGDPVLHIELRRKADLMIIAPLDANTLAKMAGGLCDNLLTCIARAWDTNKPLLYAPAMNTYMWNHPLTAKHISTLNDLGYKEIPCVEKTLICGDKGLGAMAHMSSIVTAIEKELFEMKFTQTQHPE